VPWDAPGSTAIAVLTGEAELVIGDVYSRYASAGRQGMTPHVTLIVPFVPAADLDASVENRLRALFNRVQPFDYVLERFEYFESGVLYLAPEPSAPFVDVVQALAAELPDYPPYEGLHDDVIPHVTIAESRDQELLARIRSEIEPRLPIACRAQTATLVERGLDFRWRPRTAYTFGSLE
jgi:2'-5' RNA ligase